MLYVKPNFSTNLSGKKLLIIYSKIQVTSSQLNSEYILIEWINGRQFIVIKNEMMQMIFKNGDLLWKPVILKFFIQSRKLFLIDDS